jgi:hypothetical protein
MLGVDFENFVSSSNYFSVAATRPLLPESHSIDLSQSLDSFKPIVLKIRENSPSMVPLIGGGCIVNDVFWVVQHCNQLSKTPTCPGRRINP